MVNINGLTTLLFVLNHLQVWTSPSVGRWTKPCLFRDRKSQIVPQPSPMRRKEQLIPLRSGKQNVSFYSNRQFGPPKTKQYNPDYGYEPYWEGGDWVFDPVLPKPKGDCGTHCNRLYRAYGPICGRNKHFKHKTFANYCYMVDHDCNATEGWLIAYRGECQKELKTYPTAAKKLVTRAMRWVDDFEQKYTLSTPYRK